MSLTFGDTKIAFGHMSDQELLRAYWLFRGLDVSILANFGPKAISAAMMLRLPVRWLIKRTIFQHFVGGEGLDDCQSVIDRLHQHGVDTILDFASERNTSDAEFDRCADEVIASIERAKSRPEIAFAVFKTSAMAPFSLLQKISCGDALNSEEATASKRMQQRIERVCESAAAANVRLFIDAEESWVQKAIDDLAVEMMRKHNRDHVIIYTTAQMYRTDRLEYLQWLHNDARKDGFKVGIKLVRGAYMEKERLRAKNHGYRSPIQPNRQATDRDYNLGLRFCLDNTQNIALCIGTHNEESSELAVRLMHERNIDKDDHSVYFSQLYGMSDNLTYNLAHHGYCVAKYVPYGPIDAVLPYLFRRAAENRSVQDQTSRQLTLIESELKQRNLIK